jgi:sugar phosphate isomerase/epimerase
MSYVEGLGVQSFCFRAFKANGDVAEKVKQCGLSAIEICGVHVDFKAPETFDAAIATYRDAGVAIMSIGVQRFSGEEDVERNYFEFAKRAGCSTISADFAVDRFHDALRVAEKLSEEYGIPLAIHNHGGRHWLGSSQMLAQVFSLSSPRIGLMLDTAWALHSHEDPVKMAEQFAGRLYGVHVKDFEFDRAGAHRDVVVGTGNLDLPALFSAMGNAGFSGNVILEYEGDVDNPVPALKGCVDAMRALG